MISESFKSVVTILAKSGGKILFVKDKGKYALPSVVYDEERDEGLKDVLVRLLDNHLDGSGEVSFLGSSLRKRGKMVILDYNFLVEGNFKARSENKRWVSYDGISGVDLDEKSTLFLNIHLNDIIK